MRFKVVQVIDRLGLVGPDYGAMMRQTGIEVDLVKFNCATEEETTATAHDADAIMGVVTLQSLLRAVWIWFFVRFGCCASLLADRVR